MFGSFFGHRKDSIADMGGMENLVVSTLASRLDEIMETASAEVQARGKDIIKTGFDEIQAKMVDGVKNFDAQHAVKLVTNQLMQYVDTIDPTAVNAIISVVKEAVPLVDTGREPSSQDEAERLRFQRKIFLAKQFQQQAAERGKKSLYMLALGPSQVGKTHLVKRLFNISDNDLVIKGNLISDTSGTRTYEYTTNGVTLFYVDTPGFFDTRGEEHRRANAKAIIELLGRQRIDIIFLVDKLDAVICQSHDALLESLTKAFGVALWKKCMVILTHAHAVTPENYYFNDVGMYDESISEIDAWKRYTKAKKRVWQAKINEIRSRYGDHAIHENKMPVLLVENHRRQMIMRDGVSVLKDGKPILESIMIKMFKLVKRDSAPAMFLSLAGDVDALMPAVTVVPLAVPTEDTGDTDNTEDVETNADVTVPTSPPPSRRSVPGTATTTNSNNVSVTVPSRSRSPAPVSALTNTISPLELTEAQRALNKASDALILQSSSESPIESLRRFGTMTAPATTGLFGRTVVPEPTVIINDTDADDTDNGSHAPAKGVFGRMCVLV